MKIYKAKVVQDLEDFYGDLLFRIDQFPTIPDHLRVVAHRMYEGVQSKNKAVLREISNYHPTHLGRSYEILQKIEFSEEDCRRTIANEYGFKRWRTLELLNYSYDIKFELAVNALLEGNLKNLRKLIIQKPSLVNQKSHYGHNATLLHYATTNGVELWRQKVPLNLPKIVGFILEQGADKTAKIKVYGGEYMASELLMSSVHPRDAGILDGLRKLLE